MELHIVCLNYCPTRNVHAGGSCVEGEGGVERDGGVDIAELREFRHTRLSTAARRE